MNVLNNCDRTKTVNVPFTATLRLACLGKDGRLPQRLRNSQLGGWKGSVDFPVILHYYPLSWFWIGWGYVM